MRTMPMTSIEIDLQVHRELERRRTRFHQSLNDILRQALGIDIREPTMVTPSTSDAGEMALTQVDLWRKTGDFGFELHGNYFKERSLKAMYRRFLIEVAAHKDNFLDDLEKVQTRARRLVARDPVSLYTNSPELAVSYAEELVDGWWVDMNLSRQQLRTRILIICNVAELTIGQNLKLDFS